MRGSFSTADLLDQGIRLYRRHAPALLRFAFGPALAVALFLHLVLSYLAMMRRWGDVLAVLVTSLVLCFPALLFLSLGVMHDVMADEAPRSRQMAMAALRRFGRALGIAAVAMVLGVLACFVTAPFVLAMLNGAIDLIRGILYDLIDSSSPWPLVIAISLSLRLAEIVSFYVVSMLGLLLPCALALFLVQHDISRLPHPSGLGMVEIIRLFWPTVAGTLLISALAFGPLFVLMGVLDSLDGSVELFLLLSFALSLTTLWTLSPLLPIWTALLYRRSRSADQDDLERRVQEWARKTDEPLTTDG
ncbi:MAG TPA: hypothetical protein VFS21_27885 [Roseiflexaceae bacterium]|nr:hypothetical protein [Roseiflexaceae bacterium]